MKNISLLIISFFSLSLFLNCEHESGDLYHYTGYDSLGVKIVVGKFSFEYIDSIEVPGNWDFDKMGDPQNIGSQIGTGELLGTIHNDELNLAVNPDYVDNNVGLTGNITGNTIVGTGIIPVSPRF